MTDPLIHYLLFLAKTATLVLALFMGVSMLTLLRRKTRSNAASGRALRTSDYSAQVLLDAAALRAGLATAGMASLPPPSPSPAAPVTTAFVLSISDESLAGRLTALKLEVNAILLAARPDDIVVLRIKSTGGVISAFGSAAAQIERLRERSVHVIASIDEMATSGGYMVAAIADVVIATRFANVGGIGLISSQLNFSGALERLGIRNLVAHAGQHKVSLNAFTAGTDALLRREAEHLEMGLSIWRSQLARYRQRADPRAVTDGRLWFGEDAVAVGLIDRVQSFDDFVLENFARHRFIAVGCDVAVHGSGLANRLIHFARKFA